MLKNNNIVKVLSILIAIVLWIYVIMEENPTTTQKFENIPVTILNEESLMARNMTIIGDKTPKVTVVLEGRRADLNRIELADIAVTADVFGYSIGENYIPVNVDVPSNVSIADVKSSKIKLQIDETIQIARSITVLTTGEAGANKEIGSIEASPSEVMISGAKSIVNTISRVLATIDVSDYKEEPKAVTTKLTAVDSEGQEVLDIKFSSQSADVSACLYTLKEVMLDVDITGEIDQKFTVGEIVVPEKITIKGTKKSLEELENIVAKPIDISNVVATSFIPIEPELPEGVFVASKSENLGVKITIKNVATKNIEISADKIEVRGLEEGYIADVNVGNIILTVAGTDGVVTSMSESDFTLFIDLAGITEGTHIVPLSVEYSKAFRQVSIDPKEIEVTVNEVR